MLKYGNLEKSLHSGRVSDIAKSLNQLRKNGSSIDNLQERLEVFKENNALSERRLDDLDDLIAALNGFCDKEYFLHPTHYKNG